MTIFAAWGGLILYGIFSFGAVHLFKSVNKDLAFSEKDNAIREEANRDRSNDWKRHRG